MKKIPWGILTAVSAMVLSFVTIAIIALHVISALMIQHSGGDDGLLFNWWVTLLYVAEGVLGAFFLAGLSCWLVKSVRGRKEAKQ